MGLRLMKYRAEMIGAILAWANSFHAFGVF
jgi:hypothetical protein